jgi:hypothetical protein
LACALNRFDDFELVQAARAEGIRAFGFFDPSAGCGISPKSGWPLPPAASVAEANPLPVGYAGGLGPANLQAALEEISGHGTSLPAAHKQTFW